MNYRYKILIVDDDREYSNELENLLKIKYEVEVAYSLKEFTEKFRPYRYDLVLLDIRLKKEKEGLLLLKDIKRQNPHIPVIMMTHYPDIDTAVESLKYGATEYIQKDKVSLESIYRIITSLLKERELAQKVKNLTHRIAYIEEPAEIISESPAMQKVKEKIKIAAQDGEITVLITGETGVGKEIVARNIHLLGKRKEGPFIPYAIAGAHRETIDSELFGHEKGAFTGAEEQRIGLVEEANRGILFLDEIGDLPEDIQVKILRLLETRTFRRLGGNKEIWVDVQFITATNRNLEELVKEKSFRKDLYYRLKAFEIYIPPLRERKEDIIPLANYFLSLFKKRKAVRVKRLSRESETILLNYDFPGNVRELRNIIERSIIIANARGSDVIEPDDLGIEIKSSHNRETQSDIKITKPAPALDDTMDNLDKYLAYSELKFVLEGIKKYGKKKSLLAEKLGYPNRFTFQRRIKRILLKFPELGNEFPEIGNMFLKRGKDGK